MTKLIPHLDCESRSFGPVFESFEQSVASISKSPRTEAAIRDTKLLAKKEISNVTYTETTMSVYIQGGQVLQIYFEDGVVNWQINPDSGESDITLSEVAPILHLRFSKDGNPYLWDRRKMASDLIGNRIRGIRASHTWMFLVVQNVETLMFTQIFAKQTCQHYLFFSPE